MALFEKQILRKTQMHKLGLGELVDKVFTHTILKKPINQQDIFTLDEFLQANAGLMKISDWLICYKGGQGVLAQTSKAWKILVKFFAKNGFDHNDLRLLVQRERGSRYKNPTLIPNSDLKKMPYTQACGMREGADPSMYINKLLGARKPPGEDIIMLDVFLQLTTEDVSRAGRNLAYEPFGRLVIALRRAQAKLEKRGFLISDGSFMSIQLENPSKKRLKHNRETFRIQMQNQQLALFAPAV